MNNTDRLFKEKLAEHSLTPRPQAWEKLEGQLSKKNKSILWMRLAAAVAVVGLLTFVILNRQTTTTHELATTTPAVTKPEVKVTAPVESKKTEPEKQEQKVVRSKQAVPAPKTVQEELPSVASMSTQVETIAQVEIEKTEVVAEAPTPVKKSIVLLYELPTITATAQTPAPVETVVVAGDEKQTGFQKILETAKDVKNSDNPWGELREAKNELLALDFKKDKNRNQ